MRVSLPLSVLFVSMSLGGAAARMVDSSLPTPPVNHNQTDATSPAGKWANAAAAVLVTRGWLVLSAADRAALSRNQAATIFLRLLQSGQLADPQWNQEQLQTLARGMAEVSDEMRAVALRVAALENQPAEPGTQEPDQALRLTGIEDALEQLSGAVMSRATSKPVSAGPGDPAIQQRLLALEASVKALPELVSNLTPTAEFQGLDERVKALEISGPSVAAATLAIPALSAPSGPIAPVVSGGAVAPLLPFPAESDGQVVFARNNYAGLAAGGVLGDSGMRAEFGGVLGSRELLGPIGLRFTVSYRPSALALSADALAMLHFGNPTQLSPYFGVGVGTAYSPLRNDISTRSTDLFASALAGADYALKTWSVFAEVNARYYTTNRGWGTGLDELQTSGLSGSARLGLKFLF